MLVLRVKMIDFLSELLDDTFIFSDRHSKRLHGCMILKHSNTIKLAAGYNNAREVYNGCGYGFHSEMDAIRKLKKTGKKVTINILVIRLDKLKCLKMSRPCQKCIKFMKTKLPLKGYKVKWVYYSTNEGDIRKISFSKLIREPAHVTIKFRDS